ncbi:MAG: hypothetical protein H6740_08355 [Alphaproteobacteria bacterium]|nr:hypothetical protein [Alphaproteobacteria bacterium]
MFIVWILASLVGCGPNCQSTCNQIYGSEPQCNIQRGGRDQVELIQYCLDECENALSQPGELDGYDPFTAQGRNESIDIENEKQAAVWMDCVADQACDRLTDGYCAPIW